MTSTNLYSIAFLAKTIQSSTSHNDAKVMASVEFLKFEKQMIFEPFALPVDGSTLDLNAGMSFTFGLGRRAASSLAKRFAVSVGLWQINPEVQLFTSVDVDLSKTFGRALENLTTQEQTTSVVFGDEVTTTDVGVSAETVVMELNVRVTPIGSNVVREYLTTDDQDGQQDFTMTDGCLRCPEVPVFRFPGPSSTRHDDAGEWDTVSANIGNGQQIAIKYKRNYCGYSPLPEYGGPCADDADADSESDYPASKSEERLDAYVLDQMQKMHDIVSNNVKAGLPKQSQHEQV